MEYVLRFWTCEKCSRSNKTAVALDGMVKCEQCGDLTTLRRLNRRNQSRRPGRSTALILVLVVASLTAIARGQVFTESVVPTASSALDV